MRTHRILSSLLPLLAAAAIAAPAAAQISGHVTGVVVTEGASAPIAGIPVLIMSESDSRSTITDDVGNFRFANLPPGTYHLSVIGGLPKATSVRVGLARTVNVLLTSTARRPAPEASYAAFASR